MMKKALSVLLAACLLLAVCPAAAFAAERAAYGDVAAGEWYAGAVEYVTGNGLMNGVGSGMFDPEGKTTRGQLVTILHRLEGKPVPAGGASFQDVKPSDYFSDAVRWAAANSIVNGVGDNLFAPESPITRAQMAAILYRYAGYKGYDTSRAVSLAKFMDYNKIERYAMEALRWANSSGLVNGTGADTLDPNGNATRAQAAAMLMRFCENTVGTKDPGGLEVIPLEYNDWEDELLFTIYLPGHWEDNCYYDSSEGDGFVSLDLYDGPNYEDNQGYDGRFMSIAVGDFASMPHPNKELIATVQVRGEMYDIVRTGPTDVRFNYESVYLTNSYQEKVLGIETVVDSIEFPDTVTVIS